MSTSTCFFCFLFFLFFFFFHAFHVLYGIRPLPERDNSSAEIITSLPEIARSISRCHQPPLCGAVHLMAG